MSWPKGFPGGDEQEGPFPYAQAAGVEVVTSPPLSLNRTIAPTDDPNLDQVSFPAGQYFTGTVLNLDTANTLDAILTDVGGPTTYPIPPQSALNLKNQKLSSIAVQLDKANPAASIKYIVNGRLVQPLTPRAQTQLEADSMIFFRVSSSGTGKGVALLAFGYHNNIENGFLASPCFFALGDLSMMNTTINLRGNTIESLNQTPMPGTGTMKNLFVNIPTNSLTAPLTITIRKNGADTALKVTIGAGATGVFSDTVDSVGILGSDLCDVKLDSTDLAHGFRFIGLVEVSGL